MKYIDFMEGNWKKKNAALEFIWPNWYFFLSKGESISSRPMSEFCLQTLQIKFALGFSALAIGCLLLE